MESPIDFFEHSVEKMKEQRMLAEKKWGSQ
jgi:hypothetical protein